MTRLPRLALVFVSTTLLVAASAHAAQREAEDLFLDRVEVPQVLVDLVVEDANGKPVLDLREEEVRIFDEDREVEILGFSPPAAGEPESVPARRGRESRDSATTLEADPSRAHLLVVYIDEIHLRPNARKKIFRDLQRALDDALEEGSRVAVATFDGNVRVRLAPTDDARLVRSVLREEAAARRVPMMASMAQGERAMVVIQQMMIDNSPGSRPNPLGVDPCVGVGGVARAHASQAYSATIQSMRGLEVLTQSLARYPGRKSLVLVSDGLPLVPGLDVFTYALEMCDGTAARAGVPHAVDTQNMGGVGGRRRFDPQRERSFLYELDLTTEWNRLAALANAVQVSVYPLEALGLETLRGGGVNNVRTTSSFSLAQRGNRRDAMFHFADQTGGRAFFDRNDFDASVRAAAADAAHSYELAFAPPIQGDNKTRKIRVEIDRPGLRLRHRQSYLNRPADASLEDQVIAAVLHGSGQNPLAVKAATTSTESRDARRSLTLQVRVPLDRLVLLPRGEEQRGRFTVAVGGRQDNGRFLAVGRKTIEIAASEADEETNTFLYEVEVPYGSRGVTLALAVQDDVGREISILRLPRVGEEVATL